MKLLLLFPATVDGPGALQTLVLLNLIMNIIPFVLTAIGYFCIARRRKIKSAWIAFVPVVNLWVLGSISDHYQWRVNGTHRRFRIWLPAAAACMMVLVVLIVAGISAIPIDRFVDFETGAGVLLLSFLFMFEGLLCVGLLMAFMALRFAVLYDLYRSSLVKHSAIFLLLSIFAAVTEPFLIFYCRNKDHGFEVPAQIQ